jgi:hypothetical protein
MWGSSRATACFSIAIVHMFYRVQRATSHFVFFFPPHDTHEKKMTLGFTKCNAFKTKNFPLLNSPVWFYVLHRCSLNTLEKSEEVFIITWEGKRCRIKGEALQIAPECPDTCHGSCTHFIWRISNMVINCNKPFHWEQHFQYDDWLQQRLRRSTVHNFQNLEM